MYKYSTVQYDRVQPNSRPFRIIAVSSAVQLNCLINSLTLTVVLLQEKSIIFSKYKLRNGPFPKMSSKQMYSFCILTFCIHAHSV